jgi:cell division protein FtsB
MTGIKWNLLAMVLMGALIFLQYQLWFESEGIFDLLKLKKAVALQEMETEKVKKRNEAILFQIQRLRNSQDATEARARSELGMIKNDETFYQIVK